MANANIVDNVVHLTVSTSEIILNLDMSLQRHHYRFCATGAALAKNSLLFASVSPNEVIADVIEVGKQIERLLNNNHRPQVLFGVQFRSPSGRLYLVDNTALKPNGFPNHFFPTSGPSVWDEMTQNEYVAASAIRRVEQAINARAASERNKLLDGQQLHAMQQQAGIANPVIAAYTAARVALNAVPNADANLNLVSGRQDLVTLARTF
jgi:hypothetical protein